VHARQVVGQVLEHALVDGFAVLLTATGGLPLFEFVEAVQ
jgi:hypothetical protein